MPTKQIEPKYTLLIYEIVPEETKLFLLPSEVATAHETTLKAAQNKFGNTRDQVPESLVLDDLAAGEFKQYQVPLENPILGKTIIAVYTSGFIL